MAGGGDYLNTDRLLDGVGADRGGLATRWEEEGVDSDSDGICT